MSRELRGRGHDAIDGDEELCYWGDPTTGVPLSSSAFEHWIWGVDKLRSLAADQTHGASFFCGGSRNVDRFVEIFDEVIVLEIDRHTLDRRLALRTQADWGGPAHDGEAGARRQHATRDGIPSNAVSVDATLPIGRVVDLILERVAAPSL